MDLEEITWVEESTPKRQPSTFSLQAPNFQKWFHIIEQLWKPGNLKGTLATVVVRQATWQQECCSSGLIGK